MGQLIPHGAAHGWVRTPYGEVAALDGSPPDGVPRRGTALLLPGYTGSKEDFVPLLDPLAALGWRCVAVDQPGQFESPGPDAPGDYSVSRLAEVATSVADAIGATGSASTAADAAEPLHLLGHSFGGLVARAAVIAAPHRWASLTLLCSGPGAIGGARKERMDVLEPLLADGMGAVHDAAERLARLDPGWVPPPDGLAAFLRRRFVASSPAGLKGMGEALRTEPDRVAELAATGLATLVAYGEHDDAWPQAEQSAMARRLGAAEEIIPVALHSPAVEAPDATVATIDRFWSAVRRTVG